MTRQRAYQLRHAAAGLCVLCPEPALRYGYCKVHHEDHKRRTRESHRRRVAAA